jgi:molecular chaperone GrpE
MKEEKKSQNNTLDIHEKSIENQSEEKVFHPDEGIPNDDVGKQVGFPTQISEAEIMREERDGVVPAEEQKETASETILEDDNSEEEIISSTILLTHIQTISQQLEKLQKGFDTKLKYDASKAETIEYQREELRKYQEGLHLKILRPIIMELIAIHDDMSNLIRYEKQQDGTDKTSQKMIRNLESFQESIETTLEHQGVISYQSDIDVYDSRLQRVRKIIKTTDATLDGKTAEKLSKGFLYEEKNLRPEIVSVYKYVKTETKLENSNEADKKSEL